MSKNKTEKNETAGSLRYKMDVALIDLLKKHFLILLIK